MSDATGQPINRPTRPAWLEVDLGQLAENFRLIRADAPAGLAIGSVVKDAAYGHGAVEVARVALCQGATCLLVSNLDEAAELRDAGITAPVLLMGERMESELPACLELGLSLAIGNAPAAEGASRLAAALGQALPVHVKIDTGMSRYGARWDAALGLVEKIVALPGLRLDGLFSHFSMSDEMDKSFAHQQISRFRAACSAVERAGLEAGCRHLCNSGGFLDLPQAHLDMVRLGLLPLGVYPSSVCRRIDGIHPVGTLKTRLAAVRDIHRGDNVGYGLHYQAPGERRIGVLPLGYGDGYPRVRNAGHVLVRGKRAPIIGANAMDSTMVDVTGIPEAVAWDEVVLMGQQGECEITAHDLAAWKGTVSYEVLTAWRSRLPRVYLNGGAVH
ncbi:MAG: alanine racemase [Verrucomicrobia bacterium]|nr:alanine racemase [Verrucomicrobiota bacterium]